MQGTSNAVGPTNPELKFEARPSSFPAHVLTHRTWSSSRPFIYFPVMSPASCRLSGQLVWRRWRKEPLRRNLARSDVGKFCSVPERYLENGGSSPFCHAKTWRIGDSLQGEQVFKRTHFTCFGPNILSRKFAVACGTTCCQGNAIRSCTRPTGTVSLHGLITMPLWSSSGIPSVGP